MDLDLAMVLAMLPYALCDEFAAMDGDDYTPHGHAVCASLQRLGGPPCPTRADGVRIACDRVREAFLLAGHRPASLLPPNSKKRCVPMTGKQQCERVPGGCGRA